MVIGSEPSGDADLSRPAAIGWVELSSQQRDSEQFGQHCGALWPSNTASVSEYQWVILALTAA